MAGLEQTHQVWTEPSRPASHRFPRIKGKQTAGSMLGSLGFWQSGTCLSLKKGEEEKEEGHR
jgi:hypothetical protein